MSRHSALEPSSRRVTRRGALAGFVFLGAGTLVACSSGGSPPPSSAATPAASTGGGTTPAASTGGGASGASSNATAVKMTDDNKFDPATVTIAKGGTVTWTNGSSSMQHSATFDPVKAVNKADAQVPAGVQPFDSGLLQPGGTFSHTFDTAGTYKYFCIPHESLGMLGSVIVQ